MLEFLGTLFVFGTLPFWILIGAVSTALAVMVEGDETHGAGAIFTVLATFCVLQWMGDIKAFAYIAENPLAIFQWFGIYIVVGLIWSFIKWSWALYKVSGYARELHVRFEESTRDGRSWSQWVHRDANLMFYYARIRVGGLLPPLASKNKERLAFWAMYWPWSLIGTFFADWINDLYDFLVDLFSGLYQRVSDYIFRNIPNT